MRTSESYCKWLQLRFLLEIFVETLKISTTPKVHFQDHNWTSYSPLYETDRNWFRPADLAKEARSTVAPSPIWGPFLLLCNSELVWSMRTLGLHSFNWNNRRPNAYQGLTHIWCYSGESHRLVGRSCPWHVAFRCPCIQARSLHDIARKSTISPLFALLDDLWPSTGNSHMGIWKAACLSWKHYRLISRTLPVTTLQSLRICYCSSWSL